MNRLTFNYQVKSREDMVDARGGTINEINYFTIITQLQENLHCVIVYTKVTYCLDMEVLISTNRSRLEHWSIWKWSVTLYCHAQY